MAQSAPIRPSIALAALAERFIEGRRVLVFGNALSAFWEQLIERGARLVHVCDSDATRVAEAAARNTSQNVSFAPLHGSGLAVRDGAFDVGFIDNLAAFTEPGTVVHKLKRALGPRGVAIVSAPNPDLEQPLVGAALEGGQKVDYYSLYDLVHREFPVVRMVGQMPFVGYSVAELAPASDPEPSLDAGFVPGGTEEPEWFVAVGSHLDVEFDPFLVVQLPCETLLKNGTERLLREQLRAARTAERSAVERLSRLEAEQRKILEAAERHQKDVDLARQIRLLQEELERKESWILQLEARAATADARADEADHELEEFRAQQNLPNLAALEAELATARGRVESEEQRRKALEQKLERMKPEIAALKAALASANVEITQAEARYVLAEAGQKAAERQREALEAQGKALEQKSRELETRLSTPDPELEQELLRLESQLVERGTRVRTLESELAKTERFGKQLLRELERLRLSAQNLSAPLASVECQSEAPPTDAADVAMVSSDAWTQGNTLAGAATTEQSAAQVSTWTEVAPPTSADLNELRSKLDHLAALAARQQADLGESRWQIEQISAENSELREAQEGERERALELETLRARLQETEILLAQKSQREVTTSDTGPLR